MSRVLRATIQYDGTSFHGWQHQPGQRTVEGVLSDALEGLTRARPVLVGASRTDQGVHASGQAASFEDDSGIPTGRFATAWNGRLPADVRVTRVEEMPGGFHARFDAKAKHYQYTVDRSPVACVFIARFALHHPEPLDVRAMESAAGFFEGEHDFASYQSQSGQPKDSTVRTIHAVALREAGNLLTVDVWGSSFLYKMVRTMVGSLLEVGRGRWDPARIRRSLEARRRGEAGPTLPGHGLCLIRVYYDISALHEDLLRARSPGSGLLSFSSPLERFV